MLICEVILPENEGANLILAIQDLLSQAMANGVKSIKTNDFSTALKSRGYNLATGVLIKAVSDSGFASTVNDNEIIPKSELPADIDTAPEPDVGDIAGNQAMKDIKKGL